MAEFPRPIGFDQTADLNEYSGLGDVIGSVAGGRWDFALPAIRKITGQSPDIDPNWDSTPLVRGTAYGRYLHMFEDIGSEEEHNNMIDFIDTINTRERNFANASATNKVAGTLIGGLLDPTSIAFVGISGGTSLAAKTIRGAASFAGSEIFYQSVLNHPFNPNAANSQILFNVGLMGVFGAGFGGAAYGLGRWGKGVGETDFSIPVLPGSLAAESGRPSLAGVREGLSQDFTSTANIEQISSLTWDDLQRLGSNRPQFSNLLDADLETRLIEIQSETNALIGSPDNLGEALRLINEGPHAETFARLRREAESIQGEKVLRELEFKGYKPDSDFYGILDNWFTDSMLYRGVPTPFKSIIQSKTVPASVKKFALMVAGDNSIGTIATKMGITSTGSVYTKSVSEYAGRWASALDDTKALWLNAKGYPDSSRLDISARDTWLNVTKSPDSYGNWMREVNRKRIFGEEGANQFEVEAIDRMNKFWKEAEVVLSETGLIATFGNLKVEMNRLKIELDAARDRMESFLEGSPISPETRGYLNPRNAQGVPEPRSFLGRNATERAASERSWKAAAMSLETVDKKLQSAFSKRKSFRSKGSDLEPFYARYLNIDKIRSSRSQFEGSLRTYYTGEIDAGRKKIDVFDRTVIQEPDGRERLRGWVKIDLTKTNAEGVSNLETHIKRVTDDILTIKDPTDVDEMSFGMGRSKHFRHRKLDVPNSAIWDFIEQDPIATMRSYSDRVGPRAEFKRQFGRDVEEITDLLNEDMVRAGMTETEINVVMRDAKLLYDRVAGVVSVNPDALNQKVAFFLKEMASFAYMGASGFSALPDFGKIILEHDGKNLVKGIQTYLDQSAIKIAKKDIRLAGSALEIVLSNVQRRFVDDMAYDVNANSLWGKARSAFYVLNGLSPMTQTAKMLDGVIRSHEIIDYSLKAHAGKASKKELDFLSRYGISAKHAATIAKMPWQKHTGGLYLANTSEWLAPPARTSDAVPPRFDETLGMDEGMPPSFGGPLEVRSDPRRRGRPQNEANPPPVDDPSVVSDTQFAKAVADERELRGLMPEGASERAVSDEVDFAAERRAPPPEAPSPEPPEVGSYPVDSEADAKEALLAFRAALHSGAVNTVIHATPADRPRMADGIAYLPMSIARKMGLKEDSRYKGYARVENGLLGLPLQFYSFSLGAVNKTMASTAHGQSKNLTVGFAAMMGLSYLTLKMKMPDYAWDQLSWQDTAFRSFDQSGIAALYSDLMYTGIHTSMALGGPNLTGGVVASKFNQGTDIFGGVTGIAGAGPSWADDMLRNGVGSWAQGEWGEGSKVVVRNLPFARMWFWKNWMNEMSRAWGQ